MTAPRVAVIIVNYNGGIALQQCVESVLQSSYPAFDVFVVDNASTDESRDALRIFERSGRITVLWNSSNAGYSGAINAAAKMSSSAYLVALNMDMTVERDWLDQLVAYIEANPGVGAVNPLIVLPDGERVNAAGQEIHVTGLGFNRLLGTPLEQAPREPVRVNGIQGGAVLIRREAFDRVGGMDELGFLYHEDVNLSWALQLAGYDLVCVGSARVGHDYHLTMYPKKFFLLERNRWSMLLTYLDLPLLLLLSPMLALTEVMAFGYALLRGRDFVAAKLSTFPWLFATRSARRERRLAVRSFAKRSRWGVLRRMKWMYVWSQMISLGKEKGDSARQPRGGLSIPR